MFIDVLIGTETPSIPAITHRWVNLIFSVLQSSRLIQSYQLSDFFLAWIIIKTFVCLKKVNEC